MRCHTRPFPRSLRALPSDADRALLCGEGGHGRPLLRRPATVSCFGRGNPAEHAGRTQSISRRVRPSPSMSRPLTDEKEGFHVSHS
jgi:hypothetical protein